MTRLAPLMMIALLAGCGAETETPAQDNPPAGTVDKPAGGKTDGVIGKLCEEIGLDEDCDICGELDWYDDGVCDDFCANPDPDCGPVVGPGTCDFALTSELGEVSADLADLTTGSTLFEAKDLESLSPIELRQIGEAMLHLDLLPEGEDFEGVFEVPDDGQVAIHELKTDDARFDWIQFFVGDTEVGVVFEENTIRLVAEISDGDVLGCIPGEDTIDPEPEPEPEPEPNEPSEVKCGFDTPWPVAESSGELDDIIESEREVTDKDIDTLSELEAQQIFQALVHTESIIGDEDFDVVFEAVDEGIFNLINLKTDTENFNWVQFFAGDTEVGVVFAADTLDIVGEISDGDILGCFPAE